MTCSRIVAGLGVLFLGACGDSGRISAPELEPFRASVDQRAHVSSGSTRNTYSGTTVSCNGEVFEMTSLVVSSWRITTLASGAWTRVNHETYNVTGTGLTTGARLVGNGAYQTVQTFSGSGAQTYSQTVHMPAIVQGSADNYWFTLHASWTIDSQGNARVDRFEVQWDCRG